MFVWGKILIKKFVNGVIFLILDMVYVLLKGFIGCLVVLIFIIFILNVWVNLVIFVLMVLVLVIIKVFLVNFVIGFLFV